MALYFYHALSKDGKKVNGTVDASSMASARDHLVKMGLYPVKVFVETEKKSGGGTFWGRFFQSTPDTKDIIFFTKQLSVLLRSGVALFDALDLLTHQVEGSLRTIVISLKDNIKEGKSLADSLSLFPKSFDMTYVQLVRAGEASGRLEFILDRLTSLLERNAALRKKVRGAFVLPAIQLIVIVVVVVALLVGVVPEVAQVFASQGAELPSSTRIILALSNFLTDNYVIIFIALALFITLFVWWRKTLNGARMLDRIALKLPLIQYFARTGAIVQFSRTLGMLMEAGVNLSDALHIVTKVVKNRILVDALNQASESIIKQGKIAEYLKQTGLFPPIAIFLIKTGEDSGKLDTMLITVADYYDAELSDLADNLAATIGPIMLVVMGAVVGFVVVAIGSPLIKMNDIVGVSELN